MPFGTFLNRDGFTRPAIKERESIGRPLTKAMDDSILNLIEGYRCEGGVDAQGREFLLLDRKQVLNIIWGMDESLIVLSTEADIWFVNRATEKMLGYDVNELVGKPFVDFMVDWKSEFCARLMELTSMGPLTDYRADYLGRDGERVPVSLNCSALKDNSTGIYLGMVIVARDMRDLMRLISELEDAKAGLEVKVKERTSELEGAYAELKEAQTQLLQKEKMVSIGQLAAGVAHEINNPLSFIMSNISAIESFTQDLSDVIGACSEALRLVGSSGAKSLGAVSSAEEYIRDMDPGSTIKEVMEIVKESRTGGLRVMEIVSNLKDFSQIDSAKSRYTDINSCLESTLKVVSGASESQFKISSYYGEIPDILCRPAELNQAFMNLFINATQAMDKDGEIEVRTYEGDGHIFIVIKDTGMGIPDENMGKIFEPFFTTRQVGAGTGLGLSVVYNIIKAHDGWVDVKSIAGVGTTFTIALPTTVEESKRGRG